MANKRRTKPKPKPKPKAAAPQPQQAALKRRRQAVAEAIIGGETVTAIARREGKSRWQISREANAPATRLIIGQLLKRHERKIVGLVGKSLKAIDESFRAFRYAVDRDGDPVDLGPDHYARLKAAEKTMDLVKLAQPADGTIDTGTITWEAFVHLYHERAKEPQE